MQYAQCERRRESDRWSRGRRWLISASSQTVHCRPPRLVLEEKLERGERAGAQQRVEERMQQHDERIRATQVPEELHILRGQQQHSRQIVEELERDHQMITAAAAAAAFGAKRQGTSDTLCRIVRTAGLSEQSRGRWPQERVEFACVERCDDATVRGTVSSELVDNEEAHNASRE